MFIRILRQQSRLSQEQLAESSGLSLRTIQRVEAGHRISYASLRALAAVFEIDVDRLEFELYATDKADVEYRELPLWVRLMVGRGWRSGVSRRQLHIAELIAVILGTIFGALFIAGQFWPAIQDSKGSALYMSLFLLFLAYIISVCIRVGDKYSVWPLLGHAKSSKVFGLLDL